MGEDHLSRPYSLQKNHQAPPKALLLDEFQLAWLFWPWVVAVALTFYGLYCLRKHSQQKASIPEQVVIVTSGITGLALIPPAHFNGYLNGWPIVFFCGYHYFFFFFESSVHSRPYGDLYPCPHDPRWDISPPFPAHLTFAGAILVGQWLAALEGPELHLAPGGWANLAIWGIDCHLPMNREKKI